MTIKAILDTLDGVDEPTRAFYAEQDGKHVLDVAKYTAAQIETATSGLKAKNDELLGETKAAKAAREAAEAKAQADAAAKAEKDGDFETYKASVEALRAKDRETWDAETGTLRATLESLTVGQQATQIAAEMAVQGSAGLLERLIAPRLGYEMKDGQARVVVKDAAGKPSALTVAELKAEITADPAYAPLIAASKASGGGAAHANGGAGDKKLTELGDAERMALHKAGKL